MKYINKNLSNQINFFTLCQHLLDSLAIGVAGLIPGMSVTSFLAGSAFAIKEYICHIQGIYQKKFKIRPIVFTPLPSLSSYLAH